MNHKLYNVGAYIRLSREDRRADESVSVENQRFMLSQFISHMPNWIEKRIYIDEGVSGATFDRRGFQDMMQDVRRGIINLVLVKEAYVKQITKLSPRIFPNYLPGTYARNLLTALTASAVIFYFTAAAKPETFHVTSILLSGNTWIFSMSISTISCEVMVSAKTVFAKSAVR